ncbi:MAG: DUF5700 domain-containing putative Zn-dependent protease [Thermoanaerobaculia bacterium]
MTASKSGMLSLAPIRLLPLFLAAVPAAVLTDSPRLQVSMDAAEADAVLAILAKQKAGARVEPADWERLFATEGFRRLEAREAVMKRPFTREEFQAFVRSDELAARAGALSSTLERWKWLDTAAAAGRALAYLPEGAPIRATVFPVIKPKPNSFVFSQPDPAIFLALDPAVTPEKLGNTLAHELHHIGFGAACPPEDAGAEGLPKPKQEALKWLSAFGEGFAMLAAAGGPDAHPHAASPAEERQRWDRDMERADHDLRALDAFFQKVLEGRLAGEKADERGYSFFGIQGPWYTVGYRMAVSIEKAFGRAELIRSFCDARRLPGAYNRAAERLGLPGARWSPAVAGAFSGSHGAATGGAAQRTDR